MCIQPVLDNEKGLQCNSCNLWIHLNCTDLTAEEYKTLESNEDLPYYCPVCLDSNNTENLLFDTSSINSSALSTEYSLNDSDFVFDTSQEMSENLRGLNFDSIKENVHNSRNEKYKTNSKRKQPKIPCFKNINYKYACLICSRPCLENRQDSIQCTVCDDWVHRKCTDLTMKQFKVYASENNNDPYYCVHCLYGYSTNINCDDTCSQATYNHLFNENGNKIADLSPNSVFQNDDELLYTNYYDMEEVNLTISNTPENLLLIHINAVSLCKRYDSIIDFLAQLKETPSIIFISETRVQDSKENIQLPQIRMKGYQLVLANSPTNAGGTAIYVNNDLKFIKPNIKFNSPHCEACFVEIVCENPQNNHIFGAMYRHPGIYPKIFNAYLGVS